MSHAAASDNPGVRALQEEIAVAYADLIATLDGWSDDLQTIPADAAGWTVKDHIAHLAAWERSIDVLLNHQPRHLGLGIDEALYLQHDIDAINAAIFEQHHHRSLDDARCLLTSSHQQLLTTIDTLTDADLQRPYSYYLPNEPGDDDGSPIIGRIRGNTTEHYREHLPWMKALVE